MGSHGFRQPFAQPASQLVAPKRRSSSVSWASTGPDMYVAIPSEPANQRIYVFQFLRLHALSVSRSPMPWKNPPKPEDLANVLGIIILHYLAGLQFGMLFATLCTVQPLKGTHGRVLFLGDGRLTKLAGQATLSAANQHMMSDSW